MFANLASKSILILSDSDGLSRAIEVNLRSHMAADIIRVGFQDSKNVENPDLVVLAMSSPGSEPIVALSNAALTAYIGAIPMLIISDRPFKSDPDQLIVHLEFPFDIDGLYAKVNEILVGQPKGSISSAQA
jgi:hypothetical protein